MCRCFAYMTICVPQVVVPGSPKKVSYPLEQGLQRAISCPVSCECWKLSLCLLKEQCVHICSAISPAQQTTSESYFKCQW